jgi:hypothetical protein
MSGKPERAVLTSATLCPDGAAGGVVVVLWKTTDSSSDVPRSTFATLLTAPPAKPLATRRPKVPPATSYTCALFSIKNASVVIPLLIPQSDWDKYHYKIPGQIPYLILRFSGFDSASGSVPVNVEHGCARGARATPRPSAVSAEP